MYSKTFIAGWGDMDFNAHMANRAFLDRGADTRTMFFADNGFPVEEWRRRQFGPVVKSDNIEYFREVHLLHEITVTLAMAGLAPDGSRFKIRNDVLRDDGELAVRITSQVGWLDLVKRKLIAPPDDLLQILAHAPRTSDFIELPSSVNKRGAR